MKKTLWITLIINTFLKEIRNKTFFFLGVLTIVFMLAIQSFMNYLLEFGADSNLFDAKFLLEKKLLMFYYLISLWSGFLATVLGVNCIRGDKEHGVLEQLLSYPLHRFEYLGTRLLGTWLLVMAYYLFSLLLAFFFFSVSQGSVYWVGASIFVALAINSLSMLTMITLGAFISLYLPKLISLITALILGSCIQWANSAFEYMPISWETNFASGLSIYKTMLHYLLPHIGVINHISADLLSGETISVNLGMETLHFILSYGLLFVVMGVAFQRQEDF